MQNVHPCLKVAKKSSNKENGVKELDDEVKMTEENEMVAPSREMSEEPDTPDLEIVESPLMSPTVKMSKNSDIKKPCLKIT